MNKHLTDDELVLHFYGEMDRAAERAACAHLDECARCRGEFARLERTLALVEFIATDAAALDDQSRTEDLIAANRLYRGTASTSGETDVVGVLDELERTLIEIATTPAAAGDEEMAAVRQRIDSRGLLLKVRVLRQMLEERTAHAIQRPGASL